MGTIIDYIKWRGDLDFDRDPFNVMDNIVLSVVTYVEMDEIFKDPGAGPLTLKEISSLSLLASEPGSKIIPKVQIYLSFQCTQKHPYVNGNKPSLMIY